MTAPIDRLIVEATKEGPTGFTLCDDCEDALAAEPWDNAPYAGPDYLCKPCADKRRDGEPYCPVMRRQDESALDTLAAGLAAGTLAGLVFVACFMPGDALRLLAWIGG